MITPEQSAMLSRLVRGTIRQGLGLRVEAPIPEFTLEGEFGGAFVTLWNRGVLRGCVGSIQPTRDAAGAARMAARSVLRDQRFSQNPVTAEEYDALDIEVTLLSPMFPMNRLEDLEIGRHGILVRQGTRSGCFLPKVGAEHGWSPAEFLSQCCALKAGLPPDAWQLPETEVLLFTADVVKV